MNKGPGSKRARSRPNGRRGPSRNTVFDSNGPDVRVRGTAQQVVEKYLSLARDAGSSGDRVASENFLQHADHYQRMLNDISGGRNEQQQQRRRGHHQQHGGPKPAAEQPQPQPQPAEKSAGGSDGATEESAEKKAGDDVAEAANA